MAECEEAKRADEVLVALRELRTHEKQIVLAEVRAISAKAIGKLSAGSWGGEGVADARSHACLSIGQLAEALHRGTFVDLAGRLERAIQMAEAWKLVAEQTPESFS